jgi:uncharacterized protein YbjT (DUF2867 family)
VIVVTGGTEAIGSELVSLLAAAGAETRAIYRRAESGAGPAQVRFFL